MMRGFVPLVLCSVLLLTGPTAALADTIVLKSGNAAIGSPDPFVTVRRLNPTAPPQQAIVVSPYTGWAQPPSGSKWVSTTSSRNDIGGWYYYQTTFFLPSDFANPSMTITWAGDDGAWINLNGVARLAGGSLQTLTFSDANWLVSGENNLTFEVQNANIGSNPTGLCYSATINYTVPEPSSLLALIVGMTGMATGIFRQRRWNLE